MVQDFFKDLDGKINGMNIAAVAKINKRPNDQAFSEKAILAMHSLADYYAKKLGERGITATVSGNERGIKFEMRWADRAGHGLSVLPDIVNGQLKLTRNSTDHTDGKRFRSTNGRTYNEKTWPAEMFESSLKSIIDDYLYYASRHGGIA